jgi:hypothetical protein
MECGAVDVQAEAASRAAARVTNVRGLRRGVCFVMAGLQFNVVL